MVVFKDKKSLRNYLSALNPKESIGFVPTMGFLHKGHLSIIERASKENYHTLVSIFVNPTQFDQLKDLERYPKNINRDLSLIKGICPNCIVFVPEAEDLYSGKIASEHFEFGNLEHVMEGVYRKGHFQGVGTVIRLFFDLIRPHKAYFGEKDFQQLKIIQKLVQDLNIQIDIVAFPTFRESSGLAMSSRNQRLSPATKSKAGIIYQTLLKAKSILSQQNIPQTKAWIVGELQKQPNFEIEYVEIADENLLSPVSEKSEGQRLRLFIAVFIEEVRLIDNISIN